MCACVHVCMFFFLDWEGSRVVTSTVVLSSSALVVVGKVVACTCKAVVVWMAMYWTNYSDYLTGFREPFLLPLIQVIDLCHTILKNI